MLSLRALSGVVLAAVSVAGCKSDRPSDTQALPAASAGATSGAPEVVTVTANDFSFDAPGKVPAGAVTMRLVNNGKELHHAQMIRVDDGKTMADVAQALKNPAGPPPSWVKFVGGPNAVLPGKEAHATSVLTPGLYAYLCFIPSPDRVIHASKGMVLPFEVTAAPAGAAATLPAPDATIKLLDYDFQISEPLTAGKRTILVENAGPQPHEVALLKLAPGKTAADFVAWDAGGMKGPPPAEPIGGVVTLDKGARATFVANLTPGEYGLLCFVPDAKDGRPHLAHGMIKTIKVG